MLGRMSTTSQKALVVGALAVAGLAAIAVLRKSPPEPAAEGRTLAKSPRLVLGRPWFDKLPKNRSDVYDLWIFLGGGIGLEDKGSRWRSTLDIFELERQGDKLDIVWFQDKSKQTIKFEIVACDDKPPFDLCLDLKEPLRGQKRLYSWDDDADMDANVPWAREWRASAEARARASR
jgi:hypothetical protein